MIILSSAYFNLNAQPRQRISNKYIYLYISDQSVYIGSEYILREDML